MSVSLVLYIFFMMYVVLYKPSIYTNKLMSLLSTILGVENGFISGHLMYDKIKASFFMSIYLYVAYRLVVFISLVSRRLRVRKIKKLFNYPF